jgi:hypothetical protein
LQASFRGRLRSNPSALASAVRRDIISGPLEYFDLPGSTDPRRVTNLRDREATTLLVSHVEYWENGLLPELLGKTILSS